MLFRDHRSRKIEIDLSTSNSRCAEVEDRLRRIQENYRRLDELLEQVEQLLPAAPTLGHNAVESSHEDAPVISSGATANGGSKGTAKRPSLKSRPRVTRRTKVSRSDQSRSRAVTFEGADSSRGIQADAPRQKPKPR